MVVRAQISCYGDTLLLIKQSQGWQSARASHLANQICGRVSLLQLASPLMVANPFDQDERDPREDCAPVPVAISIDRYRARVATSGNANTLARAHTHLIS